MRNFSLVYNHCVDNYLDIENGESNYDFEKLQGIDFSDISDIDVADISNKVAEIRKVIVKDFARVLDNVVRVRRDSEQLVEEMKIVIDTYANGIDYTLDDSDNFITLTDDYLYFNNVENSVDELLLGSLEEEAVVNETIVIVNRSYTKFYFIVKTTGVLSNKQTMVVKIFKILDDKIKSRIVRQKIEVNGKEHDDAEIKKILTKINASDKKNKRF